jgi:hypothetical protein
MNSDKERLASWMIQNGFATGHGDTTEGLLLSLTWHVKELRTRLAAAGTEIERLRVMKGQPECS